MNSDEERWWWQTLAYAAFAAIGGLLGHLIRSVEKKQSVNVWRAALEGVSAGFLGLLMLLLCEALGMSRQWTGVIVGVSGWMGPSATIRLLELIVRKRLGIKLQEEGK